MKNVNYFKLFLVLFFVGSAQLVFGQNILEEANQQVQQSSTTIRQMLNYIALLLIAGGLLVALYAYVYDQSRMKIATVGLIAGIVIFGIGQALNWLG
jgi:hypothetical protein